MEIPYLVEARKDTGLFNAKIGIWLFLASEVMLFGGLFSAYVFLRIYADFPWPERTLPVMPGLINTFVLIASSVAVVMAWAALKLRKKGQFNAWMAFTIACAALFMVFKGIEYNAKFHHHAARLTDFTVVEGHVEKDDNVVVYQVDGFTLSTQRWDKGYLEEINRQLGEGETPYQLTVLSPDWNADGQLSFDEVIVAGPQFAADNPEGTQPKTDKKGYELLQYLTADGFVDYQTVKGSSDGSLDPEKFQFAVTPDPLEALREDFREARGHNSGVRADNLRKQWAEAHDANPDTPDHELSGGISVNEAVVAPMLKVANGSINLYVVDSEGNYPGEKNLPQIAFLPYRPLIETGQLKDDTIVSGKMLAEPSKMEFHVDAIDFRHLAMRAEKVDKDPMAVIDESWLLNAGDEHGYFRAIWEEHLKHLNGHTDEDGNEHKGLIAELAEKDKEPTPRELYRIEKQDILYFYKGGHMATAHGDHDGDDHHGTGGAEADHEEIPTKEKLTLGFWEKFGVASNIPGLGKLVPDRHHDFPHLAIPREKVAHESTFTPSLNNYYGIYFLITGLHGLHVIGGALVLGYFWIGGGRKMYRENPEWLANRVEVGGLFWHFVDLVWIFLFPILYLM